MFTVTHMPTYTHIHSITQSLFILKSFTCRLILTYLHTCSQSQNLTHLITLTYVSTHKYSHTISHIWSTCTLKTLDIQMHTHSSVSRLLILIGSSRPICHQSLYDGGLNGRTGKRGPTAPALHMTVHLGILSMKKKNPKNPVYVVKA